MQKNQVVAEKSLKWLVLTRSLASVCASGLTVLVRSNLILSDHTQLAQGCTINIMSAPQPQPPPQLPNIDLTETERDELFAQIIQ